MPEGLSPLLRIRHPQGVSVDQQQMPPFHRAWREPPVFLRSSRFREADERHCRSSSDLEHLLAHRPGELRVKRRGRVRWQHAVFRLRIVSEFCGPQNLGDLPLTVVYSIVPQRPPHCAVHRIAECSRVQSKTEPTCSLDVLRRIFGNVSLGVLSRQGTTFQTEASPCPGVQKKVLTFHCHLVQPRLLSRLGSRDPHGQGQDVLTLDR